MEIFVCVKSVPDNSLISFDTQTGNLRREGSSGIINPCDLVAVEAGLRLAEEYSGSVNVVSMGPTSAEAGLRTALAMGAGKAYLLCDVCFSGADVPATSYTLAAFFKSLPRYDIIFCGKHSADGDTGQTGAMLAEQLGISHACCVCAPVTVENDHALIQQRLTDYLMTIRLPLPCLVIMENNVFYPRDNLSLGRGVAQQRSGTVNRSQTKFGNITLPALLRSKRQMIKIENIKTIPGIDTLRTGVKGSFTRVTKLFVCKHSRRGEIISEDKLDILKPVLCEGIHG